jgi:hypothetical protein
MLITDPEYVAGVEYANQLQAKYPEIFQARNRPPTSMANHIGVHRGWWPLVEKACFVLEKWRKEVPDIHFSQIKEKFSRLRIYVGGSFSTEQAQLIYSEIEGIADESDTICEYCGTKENVTKKAPNAWLHTICNDCLEKRYPRRPES